MDCNYVEFPSRANLTTFKACFKLANIHFKTKRTTDDIDLQNKIQIKSLRHLVLDSLLENWNDNPLFQEIECQNDRNYILSNLNVNLPLKILSSHIHDDLFWRRCYQQRWNTLFHILYTYQTQPPLSTTPPPPPPPLQPNSQQTTSSATQLGRVEERGKTKPWINIYMERHLQEFIENVTTTDYNQDIVQGVLDISAAYINQLDINYLQPNMDGQNNHIPLDFILENLPKLHTLRLTYCTKTIGTQFYLGCNMLSRQDASLLSRGLQKCHELVRFCLHNTKLEPYQLGLLAHSLDKGCHYLSALSLEHCSLGDEGIRQFLSSCNKESFAILKYLDLTNNKITSEGAYILGKVLKNLSIEKLVLRLNPIRSDGAAWIFSVLQVLPITDLDVGACFLDETITEPLVQLIEQNKTLLSIDVSNNSLGSNFGTRVLKAIDCNQRLKVLNIRNCDFSLDLYKLFKKHFKQNY